MFKYSTVRSNITAFNSIIFKSLLGFGFYSSNNASYYVMDHGDKKVYILNDDWSYVSYKNFTSPASLITIGSSVFMTGTSTIWKLNKYLNILVQYNSTGTSPYYRVSLL